MTVLIAAGLICMTLTSTVSAASCRNGQHCSDCDGQTGRCLTRCQTGYFDKTCSSPCSLGCRNRTCELSEDTGTDVCTDGCIAGYQGKRCKVECDTPVERCAICPGGCRDRYCQQGTSCVAGCVDSYYGIDCKNCSVRCLSCDRSTGTCRVCQAPHYGLQCEHRCEHCVGTCHTGCLGGCETGFYGHRCEKACSKHCRFNASDSCFYKEGNPCLPECEKLSGDCTHGCVSGWHGNNCSSPCNPNCKGMRCSRNGVCADGCVSGHFGKECRPCSHNCKHGMCDPHNGYCLKGCDSGFYGDFCNGGCEICLSGACDQDSGMCLRGCNNSACESTCKYNCSRDTCLQETCANGPPLTHGILGIQIGIPTAFVLILVGIMVTNCICCRTGTRTKRETEGDRVNPEPLPQQPSVPSTEYMELHRYWEIQEDGGDMEYQTINAP
ncbi:scavenger receptor class F member 1-like [Haliotis asinina]|uniref:scavenger receptor class F member 1-like n=1 Tax=Haliotis asinina TaxID=109174 RepID=UPI0035322D16